MNDQQTYEGTSNGNGFGNGDGYGDGNGDGNGSGSGNGYGDGWDIYLRRLFPISDEYYYLLKGQTIPQKVKIRYDLYNASNQEELDILVEWYEAVLIDKAT